MSCGRFTRPAILDYLLSRPSGASPEMETHLRLCEECRRDVAALDRLTRVLDALRAQTEIKVPDGFFAGVLQECRAILPKVASERRPAIRTAAAHGVGTRLFAAMRVEKKKRRAMPIVAVSVLIAAALGAVAGALKAGLVTRALAFAEPGGWMSSRKLSDKLSKADSSARLRALSGQLWQVITEEIYWVDVDVERLGAYDLARHIALREGPDAAGQCRALVEYSEARKPARIASEELKLAREWAEATSVGDAREALRTVEGKDSRLMLWLGASSLLELGEEEKALRVFACETLRGFPPADFAVVYLARKLGDEEGAKEAFERITDARLRLALSRQ